MINAKLAACFRIEQPWMKRGLKKELMRHTNKK